jgi:ABC-type uncharacterized transport system permease subunit
MELRTNHVELFFSYLLLTNMKNMKNLKNLLKQLFDDSNTINEKSVVGYIAFIMMIITLIADIVSGFMGKEIPIHEFVFNGFIIIVLGAFGIASIDKFTNKKNNNE